MDRKACRKASCTHFAGIFLVANHAARHGEHRAAVLAHEHVVAGLVALLQRRY